MAGSAGPNILKTGIRYYLDPSKSTSGSASIKDLFDDNYTWTIISGSFSGQGNQATLPTTASFITGSSIIDIPDRWSVSLWNKRFDAIQQYVTMSADGMMYFENSNDIYNGSQYKEILLIQGYGGDVFRYSGSIYLIGQFNKYADILKNNFAKISTNGILDTAFITKDVAGSATGILSFDYDNDGRLYLSGTNTGYNGRRVYDTTGEYDTSYTVVMSSVATVTAVDRINNKIYYGGSFTTLNSTSSIRLGRVTISGSVESGSTFNTGLGISAGPTKMVVSSDGGLYAGGTFTTYSGSTANRFVKISPSGSIDTTFNTGVGFDGTVQDFHVYGDGKVLAVGEFTTYSGSSINKIARLNNDGTLDSTFSSKFTATGAGSINYGVAVSSSGDIFVVGRNNISGSNGIHKLDANGTIVHSSSFNTGGGISSIYGSTSIPVGVAIDEVEGKIYIGVGGVPGLRYSGSFVDMLFKINNNGSLDDTFPNNYSANDGAYRVNYYNYFKNNVGTNVGNIFFPVQNGSRLDFETIFPIYCKWTNVTYTMNSGSFSTYVDGVLASTADYSTYQNKGLKVNRISRHISGINAMTTIQGPLIIYDRVLSATEILTNYNIQKYRFI